MMKKMKQRLMSCMALAAVLVCTSFAGAGVSFVGDTYTVTPSLVAGDMVANWWGIDPALAAGANIYAHDMSATNGWVSGRPSLLSVWPWTGSNSSAAADYRLQSAAGDIVAVRSSYWGNGKVDAAYQPLERYLAYSADDGVSYSSYYSQSLHGGTTGVVDTAQALFDTTGQTVRLRYGVEGLQPIISGKPWVHDEYLGGSWRVWGKSAQTQYSSGYDANPFGELASPHANYTNDKVQGPFWQAENVNWWDNNGDGMLVTANATTALDYTYLIAHDGAMDSIDIRLKDTPAGDNAFATWTDPAYDTLIHLAISDAADGVYTDIWTGQRTLNGSNPGALVDLSAYGNPDTLFARVYTTSASGASYYARVSGFEVDVTAVPEPMTLVLVGLGSVGLLRRRTV